MTEPNEEPRPDPRPQPRWGQYADVPPPAPQYPPPSIPEPTPEAAPPQRRTGDVIAATLLLLIGVYDVVVQWPMYERLGASLVEAYKQQGFGEFTSIALADSMGVVINVARVVLLLAAIVWTLVRIQRGQRAFWVPLGAGVVAALVAVGILFSIMLQDPALMEYVRQSTPSVG